MTLYIVATPIGNLSDLSERAKKILSEVPVVLAEDTRVSRRLLNHIGAHPRLLSYHHHTTSAVLAKLIDELAKSDVALITDAGTPGVSDPGGKLIEAAVKKYGESLKILPIPGPSAIMAAASISGYPMDNFYFAGWPPHKKGRQTYFDKLATINYSVIFFLSPHRIVKTIAELSRRQPDRPAVVARELTKMFETIKRGQLRELSELVMKEESRGEYVVVLGPVA